MDRPDTPRADLAEDKARLRREQRVLRRTLSAEERGLRSRRACEHLLSMSELRDATCVCVYAPLPTELDVGPGLEALLGRGVRVALPRVAGPGELTLHLHAFDALLATSPLGVPEPAADAPRVFEQEVEVVWVPGLAFDGRGGRLGFGEGYYDRLLPRCTRALRVGVGFAFQQVAEVPCEAHDARLDAFASDAGVVRW